MWQVSRQTPIRGTGNGERNRPLWVGATHGEATKPSEASAEHGGVDFEGSRVYNVSRLDERYEIAYEPTWVEV